MAPGTYDYEVEGGDCLPLYAVLKDGNGNPIDLTGYSSTFVLTYWDTTVTLGSGSELEMVEFGESPSVANGTITGMLSASVTAALPYGRIAKYEWSVIQPDGCKLTFLKGSIERT